MSRKNITVLVIILLLFGLALGTVLPVDAERFGRKGLHLGLDLMGGVHLVYQADFPEGATGEEKTRDIGRALDTIRMRIDKYGVTEPIIQKQENERILVQLPGFTDIDAAKKLVEQTGFLEFRGVELNEGSPVYLSDYLEGERAGFFDKGVDGARIFFREEVKGKSNPVAILDRDEAGNLSFTDEAGNPLDVEELKRRAEQIMSEAEPGSWALLSWIPARGEDGTHLTGSFLASATPTMESKATGAEYQVSIEWNEEGGEIFDQIARWLYDRAEYGTPGRALGIVLDNVLISSPQILQRAYQGRGVITGIKAGEVEELATLLDSGALPMPLEKPPLYEEKVSATLGADFIEMSLMAGLIGIVLVMLFMIIYYRLLGVLASLALIFYGSLVLAIFKLVPVTLTLAGLGGFILSIGMAVDANVLIFERMKEELRTGRTLGAAIEAGFNRAWTAIRDSNVTTFIVCGILYWLGSSIVASAPVMGFALTLFIGVAVSMFTAIVVTRTLLRLFVGTRLARRKSLFSLHSGRDNV